MSKRPEDYFSELAKVKPSPTGIKPIAYNRPKKGGPPIGLILLVTGGVSLYSFVHYFTRHDPKDAIASIVNALPASAKGKVTEELKAHNLLDSSPAPSTQTQPASTSTPAQRAVASARAYDNQYVQIEGKWYKKTPNNVYLVNGHAVFYLDDHHTATPPAARPPARVR